MTSNQALQRVRRLYDAARAGHTGSLDPLATGLLPICLGEATKVSAFLLDADKRYRFTVRLGEITDSGDADGELLETRTIGSVETVAIDRALERLRGDIHQVPPMHSAIKRGGQPLYRLAHQGIEVEREARPATIHRLERIGFDGRDIELEVHCSKGTYVRALATELGESLGTGGHVVALRRTSVGPFDDSGMVGLERLVEVVESDGVAGLDALMLPVDAGIQHWARIDLSPEMADFVRQGQAVQVPGAPSRGMLRLYERGQGFFGIGHVQDDGRVAPRRLMNLAPDSPRGAR